MAAKFRSFPVRQNFDRHLSWTGCWRSLTTQKVRTQDLTDMWAKILAVGQRAYQQGVPGEWGSDQTEGVALRQVEHAKNA